MNALALLPFTLAQLQPSFDSVLEQLERIEVTWPVSQRTMSYRTIDNTTGQPEAGVRFKSLNIAKGANGFFIYGSLYLMCKDRQIHAFGKTFGHNPRASTVPLTLTWDKGASERKPWTFTNDGYVRSMNPRSFLNMASKHNTLTVTWKEYGGKQHMLYFDLRSGREGLKAVAATCR